MGQRVAVNGLTLVHKGNSAMTMATLPDVCKTPTPSGPVPVPYPNISNSSTLDKGTRRVTVEGKMAAHKGSVYARSNGDEPGTVGGVKSGKNMKEAAWLTYSFDVKMEGQNACRLSDKMTCNAGNTVCLGGTLVAPLLANTSRAQLNEIAAECNKRVNEAYDYSEKNPPSGKACTELGTQKHLCCEEAIKSYNKEHPDSDLRSEVGYDSKGKHIPEGTISKAREAAHKAYMQARSEGKKGARLSKVWTDAYFKNGGRDIRLDVIRLDDPRGNLEKDNLKAVYDFKFNCKDTNDPDTLMNRKQRENYTKATGIAPSIIHVPGHRF